MKRKEKEIVTRMIFLIFLISLLALAVNSFLLYPFFYQGIPAVFLLLFTFLYNFTENSEGNEGFLVAGICGFWVDVFSALPFGLFLLAFFVFAFLVKAILKKYVKIFSFS